MAVKKETKIKQLRKRIVRKVIRIQTINNDLDNLKKEDDPIKYNKIISNKIKSLKELYDLKSELQKLNL